MLVTAGPTEEPVDPACAHEYQLRQDGLRRGAGGARSRREVTLISGPVALPTPVGVTRVDVRTARDMFEAVKRDAQDADIFISVAAVADYRVKNPAAQKIKKANGHLSLELEENPDILAWVAALPGRRSAWALPRKARTWRRTQERSWRRRSCP